MHTIFWTQNETPLTRSTLIIDGVCSEFEGKKLQNEAMKILSVNSNWDIINKIEGSNLTIQYKNNEGYLISSCFEERDEAGRPMVFKFYTDATDFSYAVDEMKDIMKQLNRTYDWSELNNDKVEEINTKIEELKKKAIIKKVLVIIGIFVAFGTIYAISNHCASSEEDPNRSCDTIEIKRDSIEIKCDTNN